MTPMLEQMLRANGFHRRRDGWSRDNVVSAGLATLTVRDAAETDVARLSSTITATPDYHCRLVVGDQEIEQLRDGDQVLTLMALFLTG
jgi:hypothetical protein